jgi:hypothetical protein
MRTATRTVEQVRDMHRHGQSPAAIAKALGISARTVYRYLDGDGMATRRRRQDAGRLQSPPPPEVWLEMVALCAVDGYGAAEALKVLAANGRIERGQYSASWLNRQLSQWGVSRKSCRRTGPRVHVRRERTRPNVEHQADGTPYESIYRDTRGDFWYEPDNPLLKGKQHAGKTPVHVFGCVDAYSRAFYMRAYDGERAENWLDFLWRAWAEKSDRAEFPFCGMPRLLRPDRGSGLLATVSTRALREAGVKVLPHEGGKAWLKGKVEAALRRYQRKCGLATKRLALGKSWEDLNIFLYEAARYLSGLEMEDGNRVKFIPFRRFLEITATPERLKLPPEWAAWQRLCLREDESRISPEMVITFGPSDAREKVELPFTSRFMAYATAGVKVRVLYTPHAQDPILLVLSPLAGDPGGEFRVERVRPGARPISQSESQLVTPAERLLAEAKASPFENWDPTKHWRECVERYAIPQAGSRAVIASASLFRRRLDLVEAINEFCRWGLMEFPVSDGDRAFVEELIERQGEGGCIDAEALQGQIDELVRVREGREVHRPG